MNKTKSHNTILYMALLKGTAVGLCAINQADMNGEVAYQSIECICSGEKTEQVLASHLIVLILSFCSHNMEIIIIS